MSLAAFSGGVCCSAELFTRGYDTHADHHALHGALFSHLTDSIDFFWKSAETAGLTDRITLLIGSDFGRTPNDNSDMGKDHWPIGSFIVMESSPSGGNRVIGDTDEGHNACAISPFTLLRDDDNGTVIYPAHFHKAFLRYLGLEGSSVNQDFQFLTTEDFDFFWLVQAGFFRFPLICKCCRGQKLIVMTDVTSGTGGSDRPNCCWFLNHHP